MKLLIVASCRIRRFRSADFADYADSGYNIEIKLTRGKIDCALMNKNNRCQTSGSAIKGHESNIILPANSG
jgi:hypothetical protein